MALSFKLTSLVAIALFVLHTPSVRGYWVPPIQQGPPFPTRPPYQPPYRPPFIPQEQPPQEQPPQGQPQEQGRQQPKGCRSGWTGFQQSCYIFVKDLQSWPEAQISCEVHGGNLVRIGGPDEVTFIRNLIGRNGRSWIGMDDLEIEGQFKAIFNREPASYFNFAKGEPNNHDNAEHCVEIVDTGEWNDLACTAKRAFVCKS